MKRWITRTFAIAACAFLVSAESKVSAGTTPSVLTKAKVGTAQISKATVVRRADWLMLNPQPLPPRWNPPWIRQALNPQPLPPRWNPPIVRQGLNPQPLPPR